MKRPPPPWSTIAGSYEGSVSQITDRGFFGDMHSLLSVSRAVSWPTPGSNRWFRPRD
jgi:hypothetical protein